MIRDFLLGIVASIALTASASAQLSDQWKTLIKLTGKCQYQLFKELGSIPCSDSIKYGVLTNGQIDHVLGYRGRRDQIGDTVEREMRVAHKSLNFKAR